MSKEAIPRDGNQTPILSFYKPSIEVVGSGAKKVPVSFTTGAASARADIISGGAYLVSCTEDVLLKQGDSSVAISSDTEDGVILLCGGGSLPLLFDKTSTNLAYMYPSGGAAGHLNLVFTSALDG